MRNLALLFTILYAAFQSVCAQSEGKTIFSYDNKKAIVVDNSLVEPFDVVDKLNVREEYRESRRILELKRISVDFSHMVIMEKLKYEQVCFYKTEFGLRVLRQPGPTVALSQREAWQYIRADLCWDGYDHEYIYTRLGKDIYAFILLGKDYGYRPPQITVIVASSTTDIKVVLNRYYDVISLINTDTNFSMKLKDKQGKELLLYREGDLLKLSSE